MRFVSCVADVVLPLVCAQEMEKRAAAAAISVNNTQGRKQTRNTERQRGCGRVLGKHVHGSE